MLKILSMYSKIATIISSSSSGAALNGGMELGHLVFGIGMRNNHCGLMSQEIHYNT